MENSTLEVLTSLRSSLDSAITAVSTVKEQKADPADLLKKVRENGALERLVRSFSRSIVNQIAYNDELITDYKFSIDSSGMVEVEAYKVDEHSIKNTAEDALMDFIGDLFYAISVADS